MPDTAAVTLIQDNLYQVGGEGLGPALPPGSVLSCHASCECSAACTRAGGGLCVIDAGTGPEVQWTHGMQLEVFHARVLCCEVVSVVKSKRPIA